MHHLVDRLGEETAWPNVLVPFDLRETISTGTAAKRAGCTMRTIRNWSDIDGIGKKVGGRLRISAVALQMKLETDREALALYRTGDREHPRVVAYFDRLGLGGLVSKWRAQKKGNPGDIGNLDVPRMTLSA